MPSMKYENDFGPKCADGPHFKNVFSLLLYVKVKQGPALYYYTSE